MVGRRGLIFKSDAGVSSKNKTAVPSAVDPFSSFDYYDPPMDDRMVLQHLENHI